MTYTIHNDYLEVEISEHGAEIKLIKLNGINYLHDGNPVYWDRTAPILFPNVGAIKNGYSIIDGQKYPMKKHGILRDLDFETTYRCKDTIIMKLKSTPLSNIIYPYDWTVEISYQVDGKKLNSSINIINNSTKVMPFSLGLHPAFKVPLSENENFNDYVIDFEKSGTYEMPTVNLHTGTIDFEKRWKTFTNLKSLPLNYEDYEQDALIFENILSNKVTLHNQKNTHGVKFTFNDFPMLGIWTPAAKKAPFICIEPWIGCGDTSTHDGFFFHKRDIILLGKNESRQIKYSFELY